MTERVLESFLGAAVAFEENAHRLHGMLEVALERGLVAIERTAKSEFGEYQPAAGPHPGWPELAEATKDQRIKQGFSENDPLERTGELMDAVTHDRQGLEGDVGVMGGVTHSAYPDGSGAVDMGELMGWMEFGTSKAPARPVLGPALFRNIETLRMLVGAATVSGLIGEERIHDALGYNFTITR